MKERIGQADVEVVVLDANSQQVQAPLSERERWTIEAVDAALRGDPHFQAQYPGAVLGRVEIMQGIQEMGAGRYYLRYRTDTTTTEFWGGLAKGRTPTINMKTGQVTVPIQPQTPH